MSETQRVAHVYGLGGTGISIVSELERFRSGPTDSGFARLQLTYVDTSDANFSSIKVMEDYYAVPKLKPEHDTTGRVREGSGGIRKENYEAIVSIIPNLLQRHPPGDYNIVIHSGGGGTGSVAGPLLVSELIARGETVIAIVVGDASSVNFIMNTVGTLESYQGIAEVRDRPTVVSYHENQSSAHEQVVNREVVEMVTALCALFSGTNRRLDDADIYNVFTFNRVTSFPASAVGLSFVQGRGDLSELGNIISVATLIREGQEAEIGDVIPEYQRVGVRTTDEASPDSPVHFITSDGVLSRVHDRLYRQKIEIQQRQTSRLPTNSIRLSNESKPKSGNGMVI